MIPLFAFAVGIVFTLAIVVAVYLRASPTKWLLRGYRWVRAEYSYHIHDDDPKHHSQIVTIQLEALRPGVDHFENRYLWSGKGQEAEPEILSPGHNLMTPVVQLGMWKHYYVYLGRELAVGERVDITILQEFYDSEGKFEPFLAKAVVEPLDHLVLCATVPRDRPPLEIFHQELSAPRPADSLIRRVPGKFDTAKYEMRWDIDSPIFGHVYEIRWAW